MASHIVADGTAVSGVGRPRKHGGSRWNYLPVLHDSEDRRGYDGTPHPWSTRARNAFGTPGLKAKSYYMDLLEILL